MRERLTIIIGLLTLYPLAELTRLIFAWGKLDAELVFELSFMWAFYITAITMVYKFIRRK